MTVILLVFLTSESTLETSSGETQVPTRTRATRLARGEDSRGPKPSRGPAKSYQPAPPPPPEEDILYQWRLAHKMEKAQKQAALYGPLPKPKAGPFLGMPHRGPSHGHVLELSGSATVPEPFGPSLRTSPVPSCERPSSGQLQLQLGGLQRGLPEEPASSSHDTQQPGSTSTAVTHSVLPVTSTTSVTTSPTIPPTSSAPKIPLSSSVTSSVLSDTRFTLAQVPSHLHLSCDILPCPHQSALLDVGTTDTAPKAPLSVPVVEHQSRELSAKSGKSESSHPVQGPGLLRDGGMQLTGLSVGNQTRPTAELRPHKMHEEGEQVERRKSSKAPVHQRSKPLGRENSKVASHPSGLVWQSSEPHKEKCIGEDRREDKGHRPRKGGRRKTGHDKDVSAEEASYLGNIIGEARIILVT